MHLDFYSKNQKIYDAFSNEWDCCSKFGEVSQDDDGINNNFPMLPPPSAAAGDWSLEPDTLLTDSSSSITSYSASTIEDRSFSITPLAEISFDWEEFEVFQLLY